MITKTMILITDEKTRLDTGDYGDSFCVYSGSHYIGDVIAEIADSNIDIYNHGLYNFIAEEPDWVEQALDEYGWNGSLTAAAQMGQYLKSTQNLYDNLDDSILNYCYNYLLNILHVEEITAEQNQELIDKCTNVDNNDTLGTFEDCCTELMGLKDE